MISKEGANALGFELVGQNEIGVSQEISVYRHYVLFDVQSALIAHHRIKD